MEVPDHARDLSFACIDLNQSIISAFQPILFNMASLISTTWEESLSGADEK